MEFPGGFSPLRAPVDGVAERVGADIAGYLLTRPAWAASYRKAVQTCADCDKTRACRAWQAGHDMADKAPDFCDNRDWLDRVVAEGPAR